MIYLANNEIIKQPELIQDLPSLSLPVLDGIETGATIVLGTQLSVSNMPTGATLYVNGSAVQGSTFTITPIATARNNGYNYTINLQYKGVSGYEDSEISSYTLKMKNPSPTVSLDSGVFTQSSKSITVTRAENVYESEQDQRCIHGEYDSTSEGTWCNVLMLSDTSNTCQFNFFIRETDYADRSDVVTRYYHIAGSESMPTSTIYYNENNENFTISVNNWPTDPVNGSYMSSDYTIYYSINDDTTINTQYNGIAISCSAGDVIRAKVVSGAGFADSATTTYNVPVPASFSDNYAFNDFGQDTQYDDGDTIEITGTTTVPLAIWDINNDEQVIPDSAPTCTSSDSSIASVSWDSENSYINITTGSTEDDATISMSITIDGTTYNTTLDVTVSAAQPETTSIPFNPASVTGNVPTSSGSSGEGTLSNDGVEIYCDNWYIGGGQYRTQNGATLIRITGTTNFITQIEFDGVEGYGCSNMALSIGNGSLDDTDAPNGVYTGNGEDTSIEFVLSNRVRFTEIRVILGDEIPEPAPSFSDNYAFYLEDAEEIFDDGGELTLFNGSSSVVKIFDTNNEVAVTPDSTPTCFSEDDEGVTITWSDNDNAFTITALDADLEIPVYIEVVIDGVTYNVSFTVITVAAE